MPRRATGIAGGALAQVILLTATAVAQGPAPLQASGTLRASAARSGLVIGAAAFPEGLKDERYAGVLGREFNALTPENAMKWGPIHPEPMRWNFEPADRLVAFAAAHQMKVKGHALLWHDMLPRYVKGLPAEELRHAVHEHIRTLVGRYKGRVYAWDVVNEALGDAGGLRPSVFREKLGEGYIAEAFRIAHEADPEALLIYNDYGCEGAGSKSDRQYTLLRGLKEAGVPVHGVGLQMHIQAAHAPRVQDVSANIERLGALGLRVYISEMDIRLRGLTTPWPERLELQSKICRELIGACVRQRSFDGITFWGFTDAHSWINQEHGKDRPLLFDQDYAPKPAYFAVREALGRSRSPAPEP
jgi:endo-1,4-beta-xylanase